MVDDLNMTLSQFMKNAEVIEGIQDLHELEHERNALIKAQESLRSHIDHITSLIEQERSRSSAVAKRVEEARKKVLQIADLGSTAKERESAVKPRHSKKSWRRQNAAKARISRSNPSF